MQWAIDQRTPIPPRLEFYDHIARTAAHGSPVVANVAQFIRDQVAARSYGLTAAQLARREAVAILLWCQNNIDYVPDPAGPDIVHDVSWTLVNGGDCEDIAICVVAIAMSMGFYATVRWLTKERPSDPQSHVSSMIWVNENWEWAEATVRADFGEEPFSAAHRLNAVARVGAGAASS